VGAPGKGMKIVTALDKVRREIAILQQLTSHTNITRLLEVMDDPKADNLYLILEFASHGTVMSWDGKAELYRCNALYTTTKDGGMPEDSARRVFCDTLSAVEVLHANRIIHRDIKPDNMLLSADGTVKLGDFGVSRQFGEKEDNKLRDSQGTPHYYAPETCTGELYDPFLVDVWAMGVTLYVLVLGRCPWYSSDPNSADIYDQIQGAPLSFPPAHSKATNCSVSSDLRDLLALMLEKEPSKRIRLSDIRTHSWVNPKPNTAASAKS